MMNERHWLYKLTAWTVTLGLLLQSFPIWWGLNYSPVAAESLAANGITAAPPASPLTIARSQSSYASGEGLMVTYAIHNSLPPTQAPDVVPGQTLTDTLTALDAFDPLADPNSLRQVILVVEPTAANFVNASLPASLDNGVYTFHLDDIPPLGKATVTIELDGPGGVTEPTSLDNGATGWGMVNGRAYQAAAPPAILWPDSMGDWLNCTLDANCDDEYVIAQAAELGQEPAAIFAFVRDLPFESYAGSLRGARGTLWSEAGNSVDQASLLIALLRASGVPARYRSGELANGDIETLILSMFPAPLGVVGYLPDDNPFPLADPLQNPALWAESRDHYWVEAYLPGLGWTDLDPSFAAAEIGDRFVADPHPVALSELPADVRHSVNLRVKVEIYHPLSGLTDSYPLDYSFSAVELVGEPVTFGHLVQTQNQGGLIFANIFHTYTPYLMLADADALLEGEPFQELITNFPLGTQIVTGEWLQIELRQPNGDVERHERAIYDAIGYDARLNGGTISVGDSGRTDQPIVSELTLFTGLFAPSFIPVEAINAEFAEAATAVTQGQSAYERVNEIMADGQVSPDETDDLIATAQAISRMTRASQRVLLMQHAAAADFGTRRLGDAFLMRPYYDAPRVHLMAWETNTISGQQTVNLDLRRNKIRALPYPGQSLRGWQAFNAAYGLAAMSLESDLLQRLSPDAPVKSVANILSAAQDQAIPLVTITPANLQELADLTISAEAKARITLDLFHNPNHFVIVPAAPVTLGDEETVGWLRGDILSGEMIDVSEDGLHLVAVEYSILLNASIQEIGFAMVGFGQGFAGFTLVFLGEFLAGIPGDMKAAWDAALAAAEQWASDIAELIAENMEHDWVDAFLNGAGLHGGGEVSGPGGLSFSFGEFDWRVGGFNNGAAKAASVIGSADPPLPPALAARLPEHQFYRPAMGLMTVAGGGGTAVNATLNLASLNVQGTLTAAWQNNAQSGLRFQQLNGQGELWVNGNSVGAGSVVAHNGYMETSGAIAYESVGTGGMGFYAPAVSGLGSGAFWGETAVTLTPDTMAKLNLRGATAVLNGQVYSGTLSLVTTSPVALQASGPAAAPHFANAASLTTSGATLGLPPTADSLTIGGTAVSLQNGLALPNFNGTISVTEANPTQDQVALNGNADYFQLALDPPVATTPGATAAFQAEITANFSDSYTVTLSAPGWATSVAPDGGLTVTPPLTAAPGDYTVWVTARSHLYPTAVVAAEHLVTVNPIQGVDVTIQPDPIYTIPWGASDGPEGATNNGQVQIPDAAYTVEIVNRSSQPHTFDLSVSGLNPDWLIFAGGEGQTTTQVTLPAGGTTWIGLYVRPDTAVLPAPGTSQAFTVTAVATADPDVTDSDSATFVMAAVPFQHLWLQPSPLFVQGETTAEFNLYLRNVGNAPGSFALTPHLPAGWSLSGLQSPVTVNPGETAVQPLALDVPAAALGRVYPIKLSSPVPGQVYTQWATLNARLVSPNTAPIFEAAMGCLADGAALAAALHALALALAALEESCENGCSLTLRDQVVAAAENAAVYGRLLSPLGQTHTDLTAAADHLAAQTGDAAILAALPGITTAVTNLETELCAILGYRPSLRLTPWMDAALPGQPVNYELQLTNRGDLTATYAVTVTLPGETLTFQQTVAPGAAENRTIPVASPDLGLYLIQAEARALDAPIDYLTAQAEARLNVVDRFVQVTAVTADPPFVETGASSTTLQVEIANIAGIGLSSDVETAVYAPNGAEMWSDTIPLNILGGAPRLYDLAELDTSGWTAGVYTITANLLLNGQPTAGGAGYGYLSVGQAVIPSHAVYLELVAPGTVTVTTTITAEINQNSVNSNQYSVNSEQSRRSTIYDAPYWDVQELADRPFFNAAETGPSEITAAGPPPAIVTEVELVEATAAIEPEEEIRPLTFTHTDLSPAEEPAADGDPTDSDLDDGQPAHDAANDESISADYLPFTLLNFPPAFTRLEQDDPAFTYTGSWSNLVLNRASGGSIGRNGVAGSAAALVFDGAWVTVGFIGNVSSGYAEIFINGDSQGLVDLYRREETAVSVTYAGLPLASHTISVTVTGDRNPFANNQFVHLDYIEFGDGSDLPHGQFEQDDERVILSGGWTNVTHADASGGSYVRATAATAWFPFAGDSFSLHGMAYNGGGYAHLYIDGRYLDSIDFYHPNSAANTITRTFSYDGFGPGPHLLQISAYRNNTTIDAIATPGQAPFTDPNPAPGSINRYEEDHPAILYNGVPYTQTAASWVRIAATTASDSQYLRSATAGDTISFDFEGSWADLGFYADRWSGYAEIFIDGDSQGIVDLYRREDSLINFFFGDLPTGSHTISVTVLGSGNPFAGLNRVQLDYIAFGDGAGLADGAFEQDDARIFLAGGWVNENNANASGGSYIRSGNGNAWFHFAGDSFTYQAMAYNGAGTTHLFVDGLYLHTVDLYHPNSLANAITRTFSYNGFGPGPHVLQISSYRNQTTLDALQTPGHPPFTDPNPAPSSINRYEEDHPALLYNGAPYAQTAQSWSRQAATSASDAQYMRSATAGDTISFDFEGSWLNLGFYGDRFSGYAEIFIDGQSQGVVDLYRREDTAVSFFFNDLIQANHTLSITVLGSGRVQLDFIEFGDGAGLDDGAFEQDDARIFLAGSWTHENNANASGGSYIRSGNGTAWFHFEGDSFTYQAMAYSLGNRARLYVDGRYLDTVDLYHPNSLANAITRTFSYDGFGPGPHILQISAYRGQAMLDSLITPGQAPFIDPNPPVVGITRFEEDHPVIRYNGAPFTQTATSWSRVDNINSARASDGQYIHANTVGNTISFDFEGSWIGVGFATNRFSSQAEIAIDGSVMAVVDLYTREDDTESFYFSDLGAGMHTITITILGTSHPNATGTQVYFDYFDVWDGQPLAEGLFEETDDRIFYSGGWGTVTNAEASGGGYATSGASNSTAWFPFTGDSITFQSWTAGNYHSLEIKIDGVSQGYFNTFNRPSESRSFSFDNLGDGPHVLEVRRYRGSVTVDAFTTPSTGEHYELPEPSGIIRLEEDHPDLRYNGYPVRQMPQSWSISGSLFQSSGEYYANTTTAGNTLSLEFEGTWVGVGFINGGIVEIFIDGESQGTVDTAVASANGGISSVYFDNLISGTHTISVTAVSGALRPDFIDIWDGQTIEDGWYNATLDDYSGRFHYSNKQYWSKYQEHYAHEGDYVRQNLINANPNIWFTFAGNDLTLLTRNGSNNILHITIDGEYIGEFNMTAEYANQPYALHFPDLGDGPHVVQIHTRNFGVIDAFEVNPDGFYSYTPQIIWHDNSAKEQLDPAFGTGFLTTIGIGDLNGDGHVELVAPGVNGRLYVYRGDGADTGDGTPILWTSDLVGVAAEPALADLTGDGLAEIIVSGYHGLFAFRHDGQVLWHEESIKAYSGDGGGLFGWGGPTVGNLDNDPNPEIVIAASQDALYVLDHQGNILDSDPIGRWPTVPVLADITGDGRLDIIVAQGITLKVYQYDEIAGLTILWSYTLTNPGVYANAFGSPAVADLTGDGNPEIIINWGPRVQALQADGTLLWNYDPGITTLYRPSPITVADVTGDGEINLITASAVSAFAAVYGHELMVLTKDGELVWIQNVDDRTASASGVAAQDLTGDGAWEILWNGSHDGFLILRGSDGKRLFNEPFTGSGTIMEYPTLGDVDGDGVADVVLAGREGIFVISHIGHWVNSRPLWNQHNYHVTNINDDWSIPSTQPNSWELHNTYRTQTPEQNPAPSYRVEITHTVGVSAVVVLTDTFSTMPGGTPPQYAWQYNLEWYAPVNAISFASELADMQPGETRQINNGTEIGYRLPSGWNYLTLPPLYVTAARILEIAPDEQAVSVGGTAVYTVTLLNPGLSDDLYSLTIAGLPEAWLSYPAQVNVPAQSSVEVLLEVAAPADAELVARPFLVTAVTGSGGEDMATAVLTLFNGLQIAIDPPQQSAPTGTAVAYTLTLTNSQQSLVVAQLSAIGLALVELPDEVAIPAETAVTIPITVTSVAQGPQPFSVTAVAPSGQDTASAVLTGIGYYAVGLALDPASEAPGPGTTAIFSLTVTNLGDTADGYDLSLDLPAGWIGALDANGAPVDSLSLPPHIFNSADLRLRITPDLAAVPGNYEFSVTAVSQARPGAQATITGTVELLPLGVTIAINPAHTSMSPLDTAVWQVTITNTGSVADSYDLAAAGIVGLTAEFSADTVTLNPGQSQTIQLSAGPMPLVLPQEYLFWVTAVSQTDERIANEAAAAITFTGYEGVAVGWLPVSQTVTDTLTADFLLIISNTGNILISYDLTLDMPGLTSLLNVTPMALPAGATAVVPVTVWAGGAGTYMLTAVVQSAEASDAATAVLTVVIDEEEANQPPVVVAEPDRIVFIGETVTGILATFTDPDAGDTHTAVIDWGDGTIEAGVVDQSAGAVTGSHSYPSAGVYTVTVTVTDNDGGQGSDAFIVTVQPIMIYLPAIMRN